MSEPAAVHALVERFERNRDAYRSGRYNETQLRREFVDPLFDALGWDVNNVQGWAEAYKEVIHEDALKIGGATKAPDYSFRIGGVRKFFVETKKPSVNIRDDIYPAFQLRRYAWSAKLPLSILTDFEEMAVYDTRVKPDKADRASTARTLYLRYTDYAERWGEIAGIFSKEAVLQGSFDRYADSKRAKRGTADVDDAFLAEIEAWRELLARNIALRNRLAQRELNFAVQLTLDRIIFLRICEDRGIEEYGRLQALLNGTNVYRRLLVLFDRADERYNSGLFHFHREKHRPEGADELTPRLEIDDKPLKQVIRSLYYPESPYEFSVLPADILGQVYERFLGKVIRLTAGGHAVRVEEKPEVRKAGGVYYTPTYIVDYIVRQTVGSLLEGKRPGPRGAVTRLRVLDPACGSGSFLIGAYQFLLDWHLREYLADGADKHAAALHQTPAGEWRLSTAERKRILLNNIYGVDIDPQAVEVTKLSLLLKVLEGESEQTLSTQLAFFRERALPDLGSNIKSGNSLIGPDFYDGAQFRLLDEEEQFRVNAFDWAAEFPQIMRGGGFDAVVGNPPYVFGRDWKALGIGDPTKQYLVSRYTASPYQMDMFSLFMEKVAQVCRPGGWIGQIVPNVWLTNTYSALTRRFVLNHAGNLSIAVPPPDVFPGITVDTVVYVYQRTAEPGKEISIRAFLDGQVQETAQMDITPYRSGERPISTALSAHAASLVYRLHDSCPPLGEFCKITRGVHPYRVGGYGTTAFGSGPQTRRDVKERPYHTPTMADGLRPFIYGRDLRRFTPPIATEFVKYGPWLAEPRNAEFFEGARVYSRKILGGRLIVTVETTNSIADQQVYITKPSFAEVSAYYLAAVLGSRLISFYIRGFYDEVNDAFPQIKVGQLRSLPIHRIDFSDEADRARHDRMVEMVERMVALHKQLTAAQTAHEKTLLQRQIESTDRLIDRLVYELYGLTEAEVRMVEGSAGR
ncbi:MAG: N-6 DNA methylase [Gemmatimonadetes bacterium]|nr:N-6 DNA methylase [Gemmatimonadota bacterium]